MYTIYTNVNEQIMDLRVEVFVNEQNVAMELELEDDECAFFHLCKFENNSLVAYARLKFANGIAHVGRVVVPKILRGRGYGRDIMLYVQSVAKLCGYNKITLNAQLQARKFYKSLGYKEYGDEFLDANIPHIKMQKYIV